MRYAALLLLLLCVGCNDERKLMRLLARSPELRDTIVIHDTITAIVEYVHRDTTFVPVPGDTVTIEKDRLRVKYVRMAGDTVWLQGECLPDTVTVVKEHEVPVIQPTVTRDHIPWYLWVIIALLALTTLGAIFKR